MLLVIVLLFVLIPLELVLMFLELVLMPAEYVASKAISLEMFLEFKLMRAERVSKLMEIWLLFTLTPLELVLMTAE